MAISTNGGSNPIKVTYNGKNCTEVWYKSSPSAEAVKVWPERFSTLGIVRSDTKTVQPIKQAVRPNSSLSYIDGPTITIQHTGGSNVTKFDIAQQIGKGFVWSAYGDWIPSTVYVYVTRPVSEKYDKAYAVTVSGNRDTIAKGIQIIYDGQFKLVNVKSTPINLSTEIPDRMGTIDEFAAIEFDAGCIYHRKENGALEIRLYFNNSPEPTPPEPEPTTTVALNVRSNYEKTVTAYGRVNNKQEITSTRLVPGAYTSYTGQYFGEGLYIAIGGDVYGSGMDVKVYKGNKRILWKGQTYSGGKKIDTPETYIKLWYENGKFNFQGCDLGTMTVPISESIEDLETVNCYFTGTTQSTIPVSVEYSLVFKEA